MKPEFEQQDPTKPIAYDVNGQPLYAAPPEKNPAPAVPQPDQPTTQDQAASRQSHVTAAPPPQEGENFNPRMRAQYGNEPRVVHEPREMEVSKFELSDKARQRGEASRKRYPHLNLSDGEFVILDIKRHPIGLLAPMLAGIGIGLALMVVLIVYPADAPAMGMPSFAMVMLVSILLMILVGIGTFIAVWVYLQNQFFMTNESVIQEIQHSLFSKREQTVSLGSIEDASFKQTGIFQTMLNYGTIRLSTEGEETTYRFAFVTNPRDQVAIINNGIEAFKNGRPVEAPDQDDN